MNKITAEKLNNRIKNYTEENFTEDLQLMLDYYYKIDSINIDAVRDEIYDWDLAIDKEHLNNFDEVSAVYFTYITYQNRLNKIADDVVRQEDMLSYIINTAEEILAQFVSGTAKLKTSKASTMMLPLSLHQVQIKSLSAFIKATQKTLDYGTQQLARILREKEALAKINNSDYQSGLSTKYSKQQNNDKTVIKTKNNFYSE
jgi:hypothetical protein